MKLTKECWHLKLNIVLLLISVQCNHKMPMRCGHFLLLNYYIKFLLVFLSLFKINGSSVTGSKNFKSSDVIAIHSNQLFCIAPFQCLTLLWVTTISPKYHFVHCILLPIFNIDYYRFYI